MIIAIIIILIIYIATIWALSFGFEKHTEFKLQNLQPKTKFTIIIPFRDEAKHLSALLNSIFALDYPLHFYEVIFVDDHSQDESVNIIKAEITNRYSNQKKPNISIITNNRISNSPKKDAINSAIATAKHEWILTTDADCIVPKYWLSTFDEFIQHTQPNCIAAPVNYTNLSSFLDWFQALDMLSLQGVTIGGFGLKLPFLCNGANFAYKKTVFKAVAGFKGNTNIASGDDVFLLHKFLDYDKSKVHYLKSKTGIVSTYPVNSLESLIQQRLRWASKTSSTKSTLAIGIGLITIATNFIYALLILLLSFDIISLASVCYLVVLKLVIDFLLLFKSLRFFKQESLLLSYLSSSILYPFFSSYIFILALFSSYSWKGRRFRK